MKGIFIILLVLFLLIVVILFAKVRIDATYTYEGDNDVVNIKLYIAFIKVYTYHAPFVTKDKQEKMVVHKQEEVDHKKKKRKKVNDLFKDVVELHQIIRRFLAKVSIDHITSHIDIGVGDAAHTAQLAGAIWAVKGSIFGVVSQYVKMREMPHVKVHPHFNNIVFRFFFSCMITFRIGHAIIAGLLLIKHWKHRSKMMNTQTGKEHYTT